MNKYKNIVLVFIAFAFLLSSTPVQAQSCSDGTNTGSCAALCVSGTDISGATGCTDPDKMECCSAVNDPGVGSNAGANASTGGKALEYQLLEKIPGTEGKGSDLPGYVGSLYKIALIIVTLSAVLMLTIGGFMYLTSAGNTSSISTAKSIIADSLIGLVIALSAWLILYVINPDLVSTSLTGLNPTQTTSAPPATPGGIGTLPSGSTIELAQQILALSSISLNTTGDCSSPSGKVTPRKNIEDVAAGKRMAACYAGSKCASQGSAGCADDAVKPSDAMLKAILAAGATQTFTITSIAGGPHGLNSKHYTGTAIDVSPATQSILEAFVAAGAIPPSGSPIPSCAANASNKACGSGNAASMCEDNKGKNVGCASGSGADHIHIVFPN